MSDSIARTEARIVRWGIFILFLVTFGDYVLKKVIATIQPWLSRLGSSRDPAR